MLHPPPAVAPALCEGPAESFEGGLLAPPAGRVWVLKVQGKALNFTQAGQPSPALPYSLSWPGCYFLVQGAPGHMAGQVQRVVLSFQALFPPEMLGDAG